MTAYFYIMNQRILSTLILFAAAAGMYGQTRLSVADRMAISERQLDSRLDAVNAGRPKVAANTGVELLVRYDDDATLDRMHRAGASVRVYPGNVAVVTVPAPMADNIVALKGVRSASAARKLEMHNKLARNYSRVNYVWNAKDLPASYDGTGVVAGVYDTGIDVNNPNFRDSLGNTRVKAAYIYPDGKGIPTIYAGEKLLGFRTDDTKQTHGSHVLGTMAGSFKAPEGSDDLRGMAPGTDIIVATGQGYDSQILDAVERVGKYALSVGKPAVMNLSWGSNGGPHDGSDEFTHALNALADKYDMMICISAGNERHQAVAVVKELTEASSTVKVVFERGSDPSYSCDQGLGGITVWGRDDTPFEVELQIINVNDPDVPLYTLKLVPGKERYVEADGMAGQFIDDLDAVELLSDESTFLQYYEKSLLGGYLGVNEVNGRYYADLFTFLNGVGGIISETRIRLLVTGKPGQTIYVYSDSGRNLLFNKNLGDRITGEGTNSNMACGPNTMSVGSYVSASPSGYGSYRNRTISYFSSYGPTLDGRYVPDLCAPGQVLLSTRNRYLRSGSNAVVTYTDSVSGDKVQYCYMQGTSMASPAAAGAAAILRQINPQLSYREIKNVLISTADPQKFPEEKGWGAGMLNAWAAAQKVAETAGVKGNIADERDIMLMRGAGNVWHIVVPAADAVDVDVYDMSGRRVAAVNESGSSVNYNAAGLPAGVYVMRVTAGNKTKAVKFAK